MDLTPPPEAPRQPATSKVAAGISPRLAAAAAGVVLLIVVGIGIAGREPAASTPPAIRLPTSRAAGLPSAVPAASASATPAPTALPSFLDDGAPVAPLFINWDPPTELYQVVVRADGQTVTTFVLPGNDPAFEGALSLRGLRHRNLEITLNAIGERADLPVPTRIGRWRVKLPSSPLSDTPVEVLREAVTGDVQAADAPYLKRANFSLAVSARRLSSFTALYFFILVTNPDAIR